MAKKEKFFFGIFEDGKSLKVAHIKVADNKLILLQLDQTKMEKSIYADEGKKSTKKLDQQTTDRLTKAGSLSLDDLKSLDKIKTSKSSMSSIVSPHENLLRKFPLDFGFLAINSNEHRLTIKKHNEQIKRLTFRKLVKLGIVDKDEKRDKQISFGFIPKANESEIIVHRGDNKLFNYIEKYNQSEFKKKFFYSLADANYVSLINIVKLNYQFEEEETTILLYLGNDYHSVILFQGNTYIKSILISIPKDYYDTRESVRSKLMFLQDESELPDFDRIILAGDYSKTGDVEHFKKHFPSCKIEQLTCTNLEVDETAEITEDQISEFAIPISLAWKASNTEKTSLFDTNFLSKKVLERKKVFKVSWHGYVIAFLIFGFSMISTNKLMKLQENIRSLVQKKMNLSNEIRKNEVFIEKNSTIYQEIEALKNSENKIESILIDKNKWSYILHEISRTFNQHKKSWLKNIDWTNNEIILIGYTTNIEHVIKFSNIFPDSQLNYVKNESVAGENIWNFEITFSYNNVNEEILKADDTNAESEYSKIIKLYHQRNWDKTLSEIASFQQKYQRNSFSINLEYIKGEILYQINHFDEAEKALTLVMNSTSNFHPYSIFMLAKTKNQLEEKDIAIQLMQQFIDLYPQHDLKETAYRFISKWEGNHE